MASRTFPLVLSLLLLLGCSGSEGTSGPPADAGGDPGVAADGRADGHPGDRGFDAGVCSKDADCAGRFGPPIPCATPGCKEGRCVLDPHPDGEICDDESPCTEPDACKAGVCTGEPKACGDEDPCTDDTCDAGSCVHVPNQASCDDGNPCTVFDTCSVGACAGSARSCDDGNPCTEDACDPEVGCRSAPFDGPCDDDDLCTVDEACSDGACSGAQRDCDDGNDCTEDACDPEVGCTHAVQVGACDDEEACTAGDLCVLGVCAPGAWDEGLEGCALPGCGDGACAPGESCLSCPTDCGFCCGDGSCDLAFGEACGTCPDDCGSCVGCGDGTCDPGAGEDCDGCPEDCGACADVCLPAAVLSCGATVQGDLATGSVTDVIESYACTALADRVHDGSEQAWVFGSECTGFVTLELRRLSGAGRLDLAVLNGTQPCRGAACTRGAVMDLAAPGGPAAEISFAALAGQPFRVLVDGAQGATGSFDLRVTCACARPPEVCADGLDNDADGKTDCLDPDCLDHPSCDAPETDCGNALDDDDDGHTDCADPDCAGSPGCVPEICGDGLDDNGNDLIDCLDPTCLLSPSCAAPGDTCAAALPPVPVPVVLKGSTEAAHDRFRVDEGVCGPGSPALGAGAPDRFHRLRASAPGRYRIRLVNLEGSPAEGLGLAVLDACPPAVGFWCRALAADPRGVLVDLQADEEVLVVVDGLGPEPSAGAGYHIFGEVAESACGDGQDDDGDGKTDCADPDCFGAEGFCPLLGATCDGAVPISALPFVHAYATDRGGDTFPGEATCPDPAGAAGAGSADTWYTFMAPEAATYRFRLLPDRFGGFDGVLYAVEGCDGACVAGVDAPGRGGEQIERSLAAGQTLWLVVDGKKGSRGAYELRVRRVETECSDGLDNDGDQKKDCIDPDCFGVGPCPLPGDTCAGPKGLILKTNPVVLEGETGLASAMDLAGACPGALAAAPDFVYRMIPNAAGKWLFWLDPAKSSPGLGLFGVDDCTGSGGTCLGARPAGDAREGFALILPPATPTFLVVAGEGHWRARGEFLGPAEVLCDGGQDDDADGRTDCADPDCWGKGDCPLLDEGCAEAVEVKDVLAGRTDGFADDLSVPDGACPGLSGGAGEGAPDRVQRFVAPESALYQVSLDPRGTDPEAVVYALSDCGAPATGCLGGVRGADGGSFELALPAGAEVKLVVDGGAAGGGVRYLLRVAKVRQVEVLCEDGLDGDQDGSTDCDDEDCVGTAGCPRPGDRCSEPVELLFSPANAVGSTALFSDQMARPSSCGSGPPGAGVGAAEVVYQVSIFYTGLYRAVLVPGVTDFDASLYVVAGCGGAAACLGAADVAGPGGEEVIFGAKEGSAPLVVIDGSSPAAQGGYVLGIFFLGPSEVDCADGVDDDGNGSTDCADSACAGDPSCP